ncbi:peptidase family M41-domain-containing protein [Phlyctochytrium arcticum]|nr:peptidase family M41-domain-containing protein [Phlyctochytrium arcticum]KAI9104613.1 peptidase family M41-domain-containing protein [Phlyctochytrium arcticum]
MASAAPSVAAPLQAALAETAVLLGELKLSAVSLLTNRLANIRHDLQTSKKTEAEVSSLGLNSTLEDPAPTISDLLHSYFPTPLVNALSRSLELPRGPPSFLHDTPDGQLTRLQALIAELLLLQTPGTSNNAVSHPKTASSPGVGRYPSRINSLRFSGTHLPFSQSSSTLRSRIPTHMRSQTRSFWSDRRLQQVESEADDPQYRSDPRKQAELYKELIKSGNFNAVIDRYENQPQLGLPNSRFSAAGRQSDVVRIQRDPECARAYVTALKREDKLDKITDRFLAAMAVTGYSPNGMPGMSGASSGDSNSRQVVGEAREHWVRTDMGEWDRALTSRGYKSSRPSSSIYGHSPMPPPGYDPKSDPIQVIISEAWSWSKFARKLGSKLIYGLLLMTGLSVLLDQQGILKSGMSGAEVEPSAMQPPITFADVQGVDEAKHELEEIVAFLKEPKKFMEIGGKLPKGILLYGPPGTGKTHLARAVAGEANVPFFQMSGSEFDELYVGVGARRVRELFAAAKKKAPCIVFIDELDAVGSKRSAKDQSYMRQTLNQLLVELDGFSTSEGVIFIAATNTPEALDKALVRPGRFDRLVPVTLPDVKGRAKILQVHMKGVTVAKSVDTHIIARGTPGFSGADLANLINQAAIRASKDGAKTVRMEDMEWAKDKIIMGSERKSAVISEQNKRLTAYHEGGHTLVAHFTPGATPLHKVTVIPRGNALGVTVQLPEADKTNHTKRELHAMLDVCMGGRVAEEMIFGPEEVTTGASSDLEKATAVAREMVLVYGMSDKVGVVGYGEEGWENMSPATKNLIETEVKSLLDGAYSRATNLLKTHKEELHRLARALMEHETLNVDEIRTVIKGTYISIFPIRT